MKTKLFTLLVALITTTSLWAYDFQSGDLYYNITSKTTVEVTYLEEYSSENYAGLTTVTIPETVTRNGTTYSVTSIGYVAFRACSSLTSITIPNSVTDIGFAAFSDCISLTSITIPNHVTSLGDYAFYFCSSLTSITIPNSVTSIGTMAFSDCNSLTSIVVEKDNTIYDSHDNCNAIIETATNTLIAGCQNTIIPNSVTSIGEYAFWYCSSLTSITIPNSVTSIGENAFYSCSSLTSITIPNSVTSIGSRAFEGCSSLTSIVWNAKHCADFTSAPFGNQTTTLVFGDSVEHIPAYLGYGMNKLTSVTIPNSVMSVGKCAFKDCSSLTFITCEATTPPDVCDGWNTHSFDGVSNSLPVYVPCGTVSAYNAARGWNQFSNIQEPLAEYSIQVFTSNSSMGSARVDKNTICGNSISATANYGYQFVRWSDGNTDNPRSLELTKDTVLTAEFAPNNYTLSIQSDNSERGTTSGDITTTYLDYVTISATANYGYHFSHWNDYNYDNPRQVQVTEDKTYTAYFDKNTYYITKNYDSNQGYVDGYSSGEYLDNITLTAEANYGYHFVQWSDGVTDNPRSFVLTQDTTFVAVFAPNNYTISPLSSDIERGTTSGDITTTYLDYVTISATANYGYHFSHWNDYNYDNPRQVQVTEDKTYTAYFDKNTYYITKNYDSNQGYVDGYSSGEYLDNITLTAEANYGYHFVQWSDGNTDNPRHFILTQDTAFSVEFAQTFSGQCGDNLYWSYQNNSLIISGFGEMYDERPWGLFTNEIQTVVLPNGITHIGNDAFSDCTGLSEITIPYTVTSIGDYAFAGCRKLVQVNCYAINPPMAESTSFANYNVYLNVPCDNLQDYQLDMVFGSFKYIQCMGADSENVPTDDVVVTPGTNDVTITWPTEGNADTYTIVIKKGNEVFCTLTFNAEGQLLNMAFAPSRNSSNRPAQYAEQAVNGYRFTVTGLEEQTQYGYDVSAKDDEDNTISSYTGEFTTQSNTSTSVSNIQYSTSDTHKKLRNGHLIIIRDGVEYNVMGQEL